MNKNKVTELLNEYRLSSVEELLYKYIDADPCTYSTYRIGEIILTLYCEYMMPNVAGMSNSLTVAEERAGCLKRYIEGTMYSDEETAINCRDIQAGNAEAIILACQSARRARLH